MITLAPIVHGASHVATHLVPTIHRTADSPSPAPSDLIVPLDLEGGVTDVSWWTDLLTGPVLRTIVIVIGAVVIRFVASKAIDGFTRGLAAVTESDLPLGVPSTPRRTRTDAGEEAREVIGEDHLLAQRRLNRATSLGRLLKNVLSVVIIGVALLMILGEWGFNITPLIAGAGILGVAIGFGAQGAVSDFLAGVFMLLEDQYGVGDIISLDGTDGTVEDVKLRVTRLRSVNGVVWWVRNGEITRVGNMSQTWSRTLLDIGVAYDSNIAQVRGLMADEAHALHREPEWREVLLEEPEVWGVEDLADNAIVMRLVLKTLPGEQWRVARELRERIKNRFDAEGVQIPFPQRTVWIRQDTPQPVSDVAAP